jgi:hypothetical protein
MTRGWIASLLAMALALIAITSCVKERGINGGAIKAGDPAVVSVTLVTGAPDSRGYHDQTEPNQGSETDRKISALRTDGKKWRN